MITFNKLPFLKQLLIKAVIKVGRTHTAAYSMGIAQRLFNRDDFVLKVLRASPSNRAYVKGLLESIDPEAPGHVQLVSLLIQFEALSAQEKAEFIHAYKAAANITADGIKDIASQTVFDPGHVPPLLVP